MEESSSKFLLIQVRTNIVECVVTAVAYEINRRNDHGLVD